MTDFLAFINKVEFGYSFSGQMTPDQLNNEYFAKCISCIEHLVTSCTYDGQVVKSQSLVEVNQAIFAWSFPKNFDSYFES